MSMPWVQRGVRIEEPAARLFCFPYAGVGASIYRAWPQGLANDIEVCAIELPGRGARLRERPLASIEAIVDALLPELQPLLDVPFALFGHSMGAVVAHEVVHRLVDRAAPLPLHLFVSARRPPSMPDDAPALRHLPDAQFVAEINHRFGGIPRQVLEDAEVLALLLPALRADVAALECHRPLTRTPLPIPITVFGGTDDWITPRAHLEAWRAETSRGAQLRLLPGDHFFLEPRRREILDLIRSVLVVAREAVCERTA